MDSNHGFWWFIKVVIAVIIGMWLYQNIAPHLPSLPWTTSQINTTVAAIGGYTPFGRDNEADAIAQKYGVQNEYDYDKIYQYCYSDDAHSESETIASFCAATPDIIYINKSANAWPEVKADGRVDDTMLHELGHRAIFLQCSTTHPSAIARLGANPENTASSYAAEFLGADPNQLDKFGTGDDTYTITDASNQAAAAIHNGQCS